MKTIDYKDLIFIDSNPINSGSFGAIKRCIFDGKIYVYKEFTNNNYLIGKRKKIELLSEVNKPGLYVPKFWVRNKDNKNQYICDIFNGLDIASLCDYPIKTKIKKLKYVKKLILSMHEEDITHSDLIESNIMINENDAAIIDFDNSSYKNYKTNISDSNDYAKEFIKIYGICPEIDVFIFNLLTFSILNEKDFYMVRNKVLEKNYGIFESKDSKLICNSLLLEKNIPNNDFLIDTIDETSIKI